MFENKQWADTIISSLVTVPLTKRVELYAHCLMPDHIHLLISPREGDLVDLIGNWKSYTGHLLRGKGLEGPCWQRGFYDHALREEEDIQKVAEYIVHNPVRAGLADDWRDYPYSWHRWMQGQHPR